jgi:ABC-type glycerol-3-phosphate transport system substrate-binding protein
MSSGHPTTNGGRTTLPERIKGVKRLRFSRPKTVIAVASVVIVAAVVALGAAAATTQKRDNVTITWMMFETSNLPLSYWQDIVNRFEAKNPGITVKLLPSPTTDRDAYAKQLLASGQFPDVLQSITLQDYTSQGLLYAWTPAEQKTWNVLFPTAGELGGKQYDIPNSSQVIPLIYYNKSVFAKLHLKPPTTWAQFLTICQKIKASGETPIAIGGSQDTWTSWIFLGGMFSTDVLGQNPNWIVQRKANKVHFTDPLVARVFNAWAQLYKNGYFNKDALSLNYAGMQQEFLDGREAMYPMGTWAASATAVGAAKFGVGVFRLPPFSGPPVQAVFTNGGAVVSAKSAHLAAAKKLAEFWSLDPATNQTLAKNDAGLIATKGFKQPTGLPPVFYQTAALYNQKSTPQHPVKAVDVMFFNNGDRASEPGMDAFYASAAQNILLGHSVQAQLKFLDQQWNKAEKNNP